MSHSEDANFAAQLNFVDHAVSTIFNNAQLGQCVQQILDEGEYEEVDEILDDLQDLNDSLILHSVSDTIKNVNYINYELQTLLIKIFKDNITDINQLMNTNQLPPNALTECSTHNIVNIAKNIVETLNKTARKAINVENVKNLIINEKIDGVHIANMTNVDFFNRAKPYNIPAAKLRKILKAIKEYTFDTKPIPIPSEPVNIRNNFEKYSRAKPAIKRSSECKDNDIKIANNQLDWHGIAQIIDCSNEHILHILDKYIFNELINEAKDEKLRNKINENKDKIMQCIKENNFTGKQIIAMKRKCFGSQIVKYCDNTTLNGICLKLYKYILAFDLKRIENYVICIEQCNAAQMLCLLNRHIILQNQYSKYKESIISYFIDNKMDGAMFTAMKRKEFSNNFVKHCNDDKKGNGAALKVHKALSKFDFAALDTPFVIKKSYNHYNVMECTQCSCGELVYLLQNYIIDQLNHDKLNENKAMIVSYFEDNKMNGLNVVNMQRKVFINGVSNYCADKTIKGGVRKLWSVLKGDDKSIDISAVKLPNSLKSETFEAAEEKYNNIPSPSSMEECSLNRLLSVISEKILPQIPQLIQHKDKISAYFIKNKMNGKKFKQLNRKTYLQGIIAEIGDRKLHGSVLKLHNLVSSHTSSAVHTCAASVIPMSVTADPLEVDISLQFNAETPMTQFTNANLRSLNCDAIALLVKKHATAAFEDSLTYKKIQRSIKVNGINGAEFMNKFDINDGDEFIEFFNGKICGGKAKKTGNKKFGKFRKWLINEIKDNDVVLAEFNVLEMTKFILDGYDAFIAHLFIAENINAHIFMQQGKKEIVARICRKYHVPRDGITRLCHVIDNKLTNYAPAHPINNRYSLKRWCSKKSTRTLPKINLDELCPLIIK